jgi:hypothetical protein
MTGVDRPHFTDEALRRGDEVLEALASTENPKARLLLEGIGTCEHGNYYIEKLGAVAVTFIPGVAVEYRLKRWVAGSDLESVISDEALPLRAIRPTSKDGRPSAILKGFLSPPSPYTFREIEIILDEVDELGHQLTVIGLPRE